MNLKIKETENDGWKYTLHKDGCLLVWNLNFGSAKDALDAGSKKLLELLLKDQTFNFGNGPVPAHKHKNGGGWVADSARVDESVFIGPNARVYDQAQVLNGAFIFNRVRVYGHARVFETAQIHDRVRIFGDAVIYGDVCIHGQMSIHNDTNLNNGFLFGGSLDDSN